MINKIKCSKSYNLYNKLLYNIFTYIYNYYVIYVNKYNYTINKS